MAEAIQVAGKSNLYVAFPGTYSTLVKLGEQMDQTEIVEQNIFHDVHGDSHGGPQGPPIEKQFLGKLLTVDLNLARWDVELWEKLRNHAVIATEGTIADNEIGALMLRDRSIRLCIVATRGTEIDGSTPSANYFDHNFPCCLIKSPMHVGQGTKFSALRFQIEAHRAPPGHEKEGVIYDRDKTTLPS